MQMCRDHWMQMKSAIDERGLGALVSETGQEFTSKKLREREAGPSVDSFEPLMGAYYALVHHLAHISPHILRIVGCPLCYAKEIHKRVCMRAGCPPEYYDYLIDLAADEQVEEWKSYKDA
jgi:hypothetical protein